MKCLLPAVVAVPVTAPVVPVHDVRCIRVVQNEIRQSITGRMGSSSFDTFVQAGCLQIWNKPAISVWTLSEDYEELFISLEHNKERPGLLVMAEESAEKDLEIIVPMDVHLLLLNDGEVPKINLERSLSENEVNRRAMMSSVKCLSYDPRQENESYAEQTIS